MDKKMSERMVALWSIMGFACYQGFVYSLFYLSADRPFSLGFFGFARGELLTTLLFMVVSFAAMSMLAPKARNALLARPLLWGYAALMLIASIMPTLPGSASLPVLLAEGALVGLPAGILLAAWGRVLGSQPIEHSIPEVVLGSALAGAVCFVCAVASPYLYFLPKVLPLLGVFALRRLTAAKAAVDEEGVAVESAPAQESASADNASRLSLKILAGSFLYGLVVGFTESFVDSGSISSATGVSLTMLFLIMFCIAVYQTFGEGEGGKASQRALWSRVKLFAQLDQVEDKQDEGPLNGAYKLSIALIIAGFLFAPVLTNFDISGVSVLVAGYLALTLVLISLFLVMGKISSGDPAVSFSKGLAALFGGELAGILLGSWPFAGILGVSLGLALAGIGALAVYLFLFTERDFKALSVAVADTDSFAQACEIMKSKYGLSPREAEILPLALRGRTGERIAAELYISKSTVETHVRRIYSKCGVGNKQELIDLGERLQREGRASLKEEA